MTEREKAKPQPEDGDEQIDEHDGGHQNVDEEQRACEPRVFRTVGVIHVDSTIAVTAIAVT